MKKLNKKGFTLVELLAVIVILAVIMVITIPTVLGSMTTAREKAFESAVATIEEYLQKQYDYSQVGSDISGVTPVITSFSATETELGSAGIEAAGYSTSDISAVKYKLVGSRVEVTCATANGSNFEQGDVISACPTTPTGGEGTGTEGE